MKAKVSVCFIVRDDEATGLLEDCFKSIRPHVEEIVVVDTGSTDGTPEIAKKYADVFDVFTECNNPHTGEIEDFSKARNRSFDLATQPWVMWMDSDDIIAGGEHLARLVEFGEFNRKHQPDGIERDWCFLFPYEYIYAPSGQCICLHYRERLISRRGAFRWVNPVHEVMLPTDRDRLYLTPCDDVVIKHQRQRSKKPQVSGRNLRILQKLVEADGCEDARQFYYLGLEYANVGDAENANKWLTRYFGVSGWEDEKTMAALKLADIAFSKGRHKEGIVWGFRAIETKENWGEGYFALARGFYNLALAGEAAGGDVRRNWEKCVHFAKTGLALPPTKTMLFVNPLERQVDAHVFLTTAYSQIGDVRSALRHAEEAKKAVPDDPNLLYNMRTFTRAVASEDARAALDRIVAVEGISGDTRDQIITVLRGGDKSVAANWLPYDKPATYPRGVEQKHFPVATKTPHARAFALPESVDIDDLPLVTTDAQLEAATIMLWKEYVLHDELLAAERLLADAPYRTKHSPSVEAALARTRRMMAWMDDAKREQSVNGPEDATIENGVALPHPLHGQLLDRSELALQSIRKGEKILDLGCFDGGLVNRWALAGHDVTGVDLCKNSIAMARRKAEEFKTGAKFVLSKFNEIGEHLLPSRFDVVTSTDTYEHMRDHIRDMIAPARRMLQPNGRMVLVTPHGSWMRGVYVPWAHPWRWADDLGKPWNCDEPHAHLIAPTPWTVAENFRKDGWWVKDSYVVLSASHADVEGQGNVYAEARLMGPICADGEPLDIVFACGDAWQAWNPDIMAHEGIGGSETMVVHMAKRLAALGHRVRVFTSTGKHGDGIFDGVEYRQTAHLQNVEKCDVLVAWRNAALLSLPIRAKERLLWVHDIFAGNGAHRHLLKADRVLALSEWHRQFVMNHHNLPAEQVLKTRNGIDFTRFHHDVDRNTKKVVYSSSPDRALPVLLKVWPKIRERVPEAELHVFYGFFNWRKAAEARGAQDELMGIDFLERQMADLESQGVHNRGKVDQDTLAKEFLSAGVWAHPTWFSETSCQLAGTLIFTKDGMKKIEDIKVGDQVLTHKGRFRAVTWLLQKPYDGPLYSVKRKKDFRPITLTAEHPLFVKTFHSRSDAEGGRAYNQENVAESWKTPGELRPKLDYLFTPKMQAGDRESVRLSDFVDLPIVDGRICRNHNNPRYKTPENDVPLTEETMFILGLFAADGCATWLHDREVAGPIAFAFHADDVDLMRRVQAFFGEGEGSLKKTSPNGCTYTVSNGPWSMFLRAAVGVGREKRVPPFVWECPAQLQHAFVEGMFAGDGSTSTRPRGNAGTALPFKSYTSISPSLAYGFAQLLTNLGHFPGITYSSMRDAYTLNWTERASCAWHQEMEDGFATRVSEVTNEHYSGLVYNFEVEEDRSYVTDRTVVHNCITAMEAQAAGLRIVTSSIAALNETVGPEFGVLIDGDWLSEEYQARFIDETVRALTAAEGEWLKTREEIRARAFQDFDLDELAEEWVRLMRDGMRHLEVSPLVPYQPRADFVREAA